MNRRPCYSCAVAARMALALLVATGWVVGVQAADSAASARPGAGAAAKATPPATAAKAALTVVAVQPTRSDVATSLVANGSIAAWQEAVVGAESNGMRLSEVRVNVGDVVRRGQVLATFAPDMVQADLAQARAAVAEAEAMLAEAAANAQRARDLQASGALSAQQITQMLTAEQTARARLEAVRAAVQVQQLRLAQAQVLAPDSGVISARTATVGAVVPAGMELFRLIRQGRLEWRAEVAATELAQLRVGQPVRVGSGPAAVAGRVRMVAPTVDPATRNGLVYVDLPQPGALKAGMFARGEFQTGSSSALTLPQGAVLLRDGFSHVMRIGPDQRVSQVKVATGRRVADRVEITGGLDPASRVVASGGAFLADGDTVRVVDAPLGAAASTASAARR
ncbi:MAG: efflux RND transporter periplasmic adaptor subunit [Aquabacterium sp.]